MRHVKSVAQSAIAKPSPNVKAPVTGHDPDDQKFIDVAVAHQALLLSKDQHVLSMKKRLLAQGICARAAM
jgi:predicted nucleic acid-binding protein